MARTLNRQQKAFFLAVATTMAMAFMPIGWLGWLEDVAKVVTLPMTPVRQVGKSMATYLRPEPSSRLRHGFEGEQQLFEELREFERLYHAADLRASQLQEQLEQIQLIPLDDHRVPIRPVVASITGSHPRASTSKVQINRGSRWGVMDGTVAVYGGVHLIGRVIEPGPLRSHLLPITNAQSGYLRSRIVSRDQPDIAMSTLPVIDLEPRGDGTFISQAEHTVTVAVGDIVRLDDSRWPASAQAMVVGLVESVRPNDSNSLLKTLVIQPRHHAHQLASVTLKVEIDQHDAADFGAGGERR